MNGAELIVQERNRQIEVEGFDKEHDSHHHVTEFINAASCYLQTGFCYAVGNEHSLDHTIQHIKRGEFVWGKEWFKPTSCLRDLVKAGALIAAAIDRLQEENNEV